MSVVLVDPMPRNSRAAILSRAKALSSVCSGHLYIVLFLAGCGCYTASQKSTAPYTHTTVRNFARIVLP
jgi:hypothetical protein